MTTGNRTVTIKSNGTRRYQALNGVWYTDSAYGALYTTVGKSWVGDNDSKFQQKIDRLLSATNKYDFTNVKVLYAKDARSRIKVNTGSSKGMLQTEHQTYGQGANSVSWSLPIVTNNTNAAMAKLWKKLYAMQTSYGGLELLGEFRETVHMIKHPAEALAAYLNQRASSLIKLQQKHKSRRDAIVRSKAKHNTIVRRLAREEREFTKMVSASWLELQFGAKPFIGALADIANASLETFPREGAVKILKTMSKEKVRTVSREVVGFGDETYERVFIDEYEYEVRLTARVKYSGQYDGMSQLELLYNKGGFNVSQLVPLAWELAPLSVFVDYFVNVGDILQASMTETKDVTSVDRYVVRKLLRRTEIDFRPVTWGVRDPLWSRQGIVVTYFKSYSREKYVMSIPPIKFTTPVASLAKTLNLAAFVNLAFR